MDKRKLLLDRIVAGGLLLATLLVFIALFGNFVDVKVIGVTLKSVNIGYIFDDAFAAISEGTKSGSSIDQVSTAVKNGALVGLYFIAILLFVIFASFGISNAVKFYQGKEELKTNHLSRAVGYTSLLFLLIGWVFAGEVGYISYELGWATILATVGAFIAFASLSARYLYNAYLLKKPIIGPLLNVLGIVLIMIGAVVGAAKQVSLQNEGQTVVASGFNGYCAFVSSSLKNVKLTGSEKAFEYTSFVLLCVPCEMALGMDFFEDSRRKKKYRTLATAIVCMIIVIIAIIWQSAISKDIGIDKIKPGTGLIVFFVLNALGIALLTGGHVYCNQSGVNLKPEELESEFVGQEESVVEEVK